MTCSLPTCIVFSLCSYRYQHVSGFSFFRFYYFFLRFVQLPTYTRFDPTLFDLWSLLAIILLFSFIVVLSTALYRICLTTASVYYYAAVFGRVFLCQWVSVRLDKYTNNVFHVTKSLYTNDACATAAHQARCVWLTSSVTCR